ncbi:NHL repeat-containing protein [Zhongshania sp.]|uniref:NHL repeat-containing protein n=1 Tax=Zhongshania sp. TaxID=1971902 RepID=UPI00356653F2
MTALADKSAAAISQIVRYPTIGILGGELDAMGLPAPIPCDRKNLFAPRGVCYHPSDGSLWVSDTGHHRVLAWRSPHSGTAAADRVLGQSTGEARNRGGDAGPRSFNVPCGITPFGEGIAVADSWNHRVLIWLHLPWEDQEPDFVLGQKSFSDVLPNRGATAAQANTLYWPSGVFADGERLYIADTGNRRVLIWDYPPKSHGVPANRVLGQTDFHCRDENGGGTPSASSMRWPHALCLWQGRLCVADAGNNRVMIFATSLPDSHTNCDILLGQGSKYGSLHNAGASVASENSLSMPYGISSFGPWLIVADTANSRLLGWHIDRLQTGAPAEALFGQVSFERSGDNAWGAVRDSSLCWPYGIHIYQNHIAIADTGNSRISMYGLSL